jgi:hypothetical protein
MKPLQTLDHAAVWYARGFSIYLFAFSVLGPLQFILHSRPHFDLATIPCFLWLASCFALRFDIARLYLAFSGLAAIFVIGDIGVQELAVDGPPYFFSSLPLVWLLASFAVLSRVGFRALIGSGFSSPLNIFRLAGRSKRKTSTRHLLFRGLTPSV